MQRVNTLVSASIGDTLNNIKTWGPLTYNVLEHGLVGDGVTDDTAALQALIDKAIAEGRKSIAFPHTPTGGQYYVTSLTNADQVVFYGDNASFVGGFIGKINQLGEVPVTDYFFNINDYGAIGDGVADDTAAIQATIDAAKAIGGGRIWFPTGIYKITDTLLYDSNQVFEAESKGSVTIEQHGGAKQIFKPRTQSTAPTYHVSFRFLTLNNVDITKLPGSMGLDLRECSYVSVYACRLRHHQYGIRMGDDAEPSIAGGFYQTIQDCEIVSNAYALYFGQAANAVVVEGGRVFANEVGAYFGACSGNRLNTTFERNDIGVEFGPGSFLNTIVGGYFEGNAQDGVGAYIPSKGAVLFRSGSFYNVILSAKFANATDQVHDFDGRNVSFSMGASGKSPTVKLGSGKNLVMNGLMEREGSTSGLAAGWLIDAALPAGTTIALDTSMKASGTQSQRITLAAAGTSVRRFYREVRGLAIGVPHMLRIVVRNDLNGGFNVRVGNTNSTANYVNSVIPNTGGWVTISEPFVPTQSNVFVWIFQQAESYGVKASDANLWIDSLSVEAGMFASLQSLDRNPTVNGTTSSRPTLPDIGDQFFDTTLGKPIWCKTISPVAWVDAAGTTV